ncbi:hypothetical protein [Roseivirga ehrenbergii]|nr:hypothetical protein [Roseivirga ehrenbergii]
MQYNTLLKSEDLAIADYFKPIPLQYLCAMRCSSGKIQYDSQQLAEDALIDQHIYKGFAEHQGPQNVYECRDCGYWHMTSKNAERLPRLQEMIDSGEMRKKQQASQWERRF